MKKKNTTLYNIIFPIWLLWLFPMAWIVVLPLNFLIDSFVVSMTMKYLKLENISAQVKSVIFRVWIFGFIADFIGTAFMFIPSFFNFHLYQLVYNVNLNPFKSPISFLWVTMCLFITAFLIYIFNYKFCLNKLNVEKAQKKKIALSLAIFTAPYLFYFPSEIFY